MENYDDVTNFKLSVVSFGPFFVNNQKEEEKMAPKLWASFLVLFVL